MPERIFGLKFGAHGLEPSTSAEVAGYYHQQADSVLASGYMSIKNRGKAGRQGFCRGAAIRARQSGAPARQYTVSHVLGRSLPADAECCYAASFNVISA